MKYKIIEDNNSIIIKDMKDFEPEHIFECGQAFRWKKEENKSYTIVHRERILNVSRKGKDIVLEGSNKDDFYNIWYDYFDLGNDYGKIKKELSKDPILKEAIDFGKGIRILNQDPYETTISFIISANNQIPRIKNSIKLISENYGEDLGRYKDEEYYSFPRPEILANIDQEELKEIARVGFRDKYIVNTSKMIVDKEVILEDLFDLETEKAGIELKKFPGVGPKVSNCILLFALKKSESFPVDVWVKRVMEYFYFKEDTKPSIISKFAEEKYGDLGGYAQQYLFYYAREKDIGK